MMSVPHSLVVDECDGHVVVADRENRAVHTFDLETGRLIGALVGWLFLPTCSWCVIVCAWRARTVRALAA